MLILFDTETVSCHTETVSCHAELVSASKHVVSAYFTETLKQVQGDVQGDSIRVTRSGMLNLFQRPACLQATISSSVNQSAAKSIYFGFSVFMRFHFQALCQFFNCFSRSMAFFIPRISSKYIRSVRWYLEVNTEPQPLLCWRILCSKLLVTPM